MQDNLERIARDLAAGLPTRRAFGRMAGLLWTGLASSVGTFQLAFGQSCYDPCKAQCTVNGRLDLTCYRNCVNSDNNNCGSCGNKCAAGTRCVGGKCVTDTSTSCNGDVPTLASLEAAKLQLSRSMLDVPISPNGCQRYRRVLTNGKVTHEEMLVNGNRIVMTWDHTPTTSTQQVDADQDGFFEYRRTITRTATGVFVSNIVSNFSPLTRNLIRRQTITPVSTGQRVVIEEADSAGRLWLVANYIAGEEDFDQTGTPGITASDVTTSGCTPAQAAAAQQALRHGVGVGLTCFQHFKDSGLTLELMFQYVARDIVIRCVPIPNKANGNSVGARVHNCGAGQPCTSLNDPSSPIEIDVNTNFFFGLSERDQASVLFHELMHLKFGGHNHRPSEWDPVDSCQALCFGPTDTPGGSSDPTKCSCATCLQTSACDPRCNLERDCDQPILGFVCPCPTGPNAGRTFPTCTQCLATCPSGLGCFGFSTCIPIAQPTDCKSSTPITCP